jgi:hypothetical protein
MVDLKRENALIVVETIRKVVEATRDSRSRINGITYPLT